MKKAIMSKNNRGVIKTNNGSFNRAMESLHHIFYVNFEEEDVNVKFMMFDKKHVLISDKSLAYHEMMRILELDQYVWISPKFKEICEQYVNKS